MSFWGHLDALRAVLVRVAVVVFVLGAGFFVAMPWLFDNIILAPCRDGFPLYRLFDWMSAHAGPLAPQDDAGGAFHVDLINIQLASQFFIHMSASCWAAAVCGFPLIVYMLWTFVSPALYEHERRGIRRAFFFGCLMFYAGMATGYFMVFPLTLRFLADYHISDAIPNTITLDSYMDNFFMMVLVMGVVFEMPLIAWMLGKMGILRRGFFAKYRRHAIVGLLVAAALITPTGDPFTLFAVFIPLYALWELGARLVPEETVDD